MGGNQWLEGKNTYHSLPESLHLVTVDLQLSTSRMSMPVTILTTGTCVRGGCVSVHPRWSHGVRKEEGWCRLISKRLAMGIGWLRTFVNPASSRTVVRRRGGGDSTTGQALENPLVMTSGEHSRTKSAR